MAVHPEGKLTGNNQEALAIWRGSELSEWLGSDETHELSSPRSVTNSEADGPPRKR